MTSEFVQPSTGLTPLAQVTSQRLVSRAGNIARIRLHLSDVYVLPLCSAMKRRFISSGVVAAGEIREINKGVGFARWVRI